MSAASTHLPIMIKRSIGWSIALSALLIVMGVLGIILPPVAGIVATIFFGWLLVFGGIVHLVLAWHTRGIGAFTWQLLVGIVYLIASVYLLRNPLVGLLSLTLGLAIYLFAEAVLEFVMGFRLSGTPGSRWMIFDGVITLILSILIWRTWPFNAPWVLGTIVGISMLFSGVARLMVSLAARRLTTTIAR